MDSTNSTSDEALGRIARDAAVRVRRSLQALGVRGIMVEVPEDEGTPAEFASAAFDGHSARLLAVWLELRGELAGAICLAVAPERARTLLATVAQPGDGSAARLDGQAIGELGVILGASMLNALGDAAGLALQASPPEPLVTDLGTLTGRLTQDGASMPGSPANFAVIQLTDRARQTAGLLVLLLATEDLPRLNRLAG